MSKNLTTPHNPTQSGKGSSTFRRRRLADLSTMGGRITHARMAVGMTQQQLADQCKVSRPTIVWVEKDRTKAVKKQLLDNIATLTGHRPEWIMHGTGPMKASDDPVDQLVLETAAQMTLDELRDSLLVAVLSLPDDQRALFISDLEDALDV